MTKPAMIPRTDPIWQAKSWSHELRDAISSQKKLCQLLELDINEAPDHLRAHQDFPLRAPLPFVARMKKGDWNDPLLLQVLPQGQELNDSPGFCNDPLEELDANPAPGLIHKYHGRVLLIATGSCAVHCRYCFRRHFPYQDNKPGTNQWQKTLNYIRQDNSITEVILSGGDPLVAPDNYLASLVDSIAAIPHIERLRIHTRLPIVIPQRITEECLAWLTGSRLQTIMVLHCNHPREIDNTVAKAIKLLQKQGITLLNQSVLLKQINDDGGTLIELSERLFKLGVLPYYLHLLDPVNGAAHFNVSETDANKIIKHLLAHLPGYLVPKLVKEQAGAPSKTPITLR